MGTVLTSFFSEVRFGLDCFDHFKELINSTYVSGKKFILVDENTRKHCLPILIQSLPENIDFEVIEVPSGEENKSLETCQQIWKALLESGVGTNSVLISVGGGMVGDLGGFVASTILRGIDHIQIPTTLLAMVDSSTGGKTGINFSGLKNQIGTFIHPKAVYIYPQFTTTLTPRDFNSGLAEIAKHALIADAGMWNNFSSKVEFSSIDLLSWIKRSVEIKSSFVKRDEKDKAERHALNFGHTIGHALEAYSIEHSKTPLRHGEAVAIGLIAESYLSCSVLGLLHSQLMEIVNCLSKRFKYLSLAFSPEELMKYIYADKKNIGARPNFSMIPEIGSVKINQYADDLIIMDSMKKTFDHFLSPVS
jgi:3-dehydroquinate synthase